MIRPRHIFFFLLAVFIVLSAIAYFYPEDNIKIGKVEIKFPSLKEVVKPEEVEYADISKIVETNLEQVDTSGNVASADTSVPTDTIRADAEVLKAKKYPVETTKKGKEKLYTFFSELENAGETDKPLRILHFGDSQIESDHITSFIRERLQQSFGGYGQGWLPVKPVTQKLGWKVTCSDNWKRHTLFGKEDSIIKHKKFSYAMSLFRFTQPAYDSITDTTMKEASIKIKRTYQGYPKSNYFDRTKLFYGNDTGNLILSVHSENEKLIKQDTLRVNKGINSCTLVDSSINEINVKLKSESSPEFYGISLESRNGVIMDNIPLRGSAGTVFTRIDSYWLKRWLKNLNTGLILLQFGVNVVSDEVENFEYYERWLTTQLKHIKSIDPEVAVIVIGVTDMSKKEGTKYVSYEAVEKIRNAQKNAALNTGFAFWDTYEAMGGENSMPSWVWAEPPLANKDFTHFNNRGSKIISNMIYNAIMLEYHNYRNTIKSGKDDEDES